ncbi:MAG: flagellar biosynthesis regulator FlaF [Desulfuromonadales bacterium]
MRNNAYSAYVTMQKEGLTGRALEAQVLTRAANMLKECQNRWGEAGHRERFDAAIKFNQKVWTFFQAELTDSENPLPREIKENIISLSVFIDSRLIDVMINHTPDLLTAVINININIAAGLMEKPKSENVTSSMPEPGKVAVSA